MEGLENELWSSKATEGLENELWRRWSDWKVLILQPFRLFTYVTTHSPTLPSFYLHHSSFSNPSVASPTSQLILQPFFCFSYVTGSSCTSPSELPMIVCMYIWGFRARQHLRSLAPVMNDDGWFRWPNDIRGPCGPKASWHLSYRWGKTPKKPHPRNLSRPGIESGPAAWQARMLPLAPQRWTPW